MSKTSCFPTDSHNEFIIELIHSINPMSKTDNSE